MSDARRAGLYVRISDDRLGDEAGVGRQETDCRALAERLGWRVTEVYPENDTSAFRRRRMRLPDGSTGLRVDRPEYRRLLSDLSAGVIDAVVAYDLDRVARDPRDLEDLIDTVESSNTPTRSVTGNLDLSNDSGIAMARVVTAMNNKSSRDQARRIARKNEELAEQGKYSGGGKITYGYKADRVSVDPEQAEVVRECARRVLDNESLRRIAQDLTDRGVPTATRRTNHDGSPKGWHPRSIHTMLTNGRIAGFRTFRGEIIGEAEWPAILDRETWEQIKIMLARRHNGKHTDLRRWLSGVLFCGHCGCPMRGWSGPRNTERYWCASNQNLGGCGKTAIDRHRSEDVVTSEVLAYLSRADVAESLMESTSSAAVAAARKDAKDDEEQLKELASLWAKKQITMAEYMSARKEIEQRLKNWRAVAQQSTPGCVRNLLQADDLPTAWADLGPQEKRDVVWVVYPRGIEIVPPQTKGRFDRDRLRKIGPNETF